MGPSSANGHQQMFPEVTFHKRLSLETIEKEGRVWVAEEEIPEGSHILAEAPCFVAPSQEALKASLFNALSDAPASFEPLLPRASAEAALEEAVLWLCMKYSFDFLDGQRWALFRAIGLVNHACPRSVEANCCLSIPFDAAAPETSKQVRLIAQRQIAAGEPLRMSYVCPFASREQVEALQEVHDFRCTCSVCSRGCDEGPLLIFGCSSPACITGPSQVKLSKCSVCKAVYYCSRECQRAHWKEHKLVCAPATGDNPPDLEGAVLARLDMEFDEVMSLSAACLDLAAESLGAQRRFAGEKELEEGLQTTGAFLKRWTQGSPKLRGSHSHLHYGRGNYVKMALSRLAMRTRLLGREPRGGSGPLARRASRELEACLSVCLACLPRFNVEIFSLLEDVRDLRETAQNLLGLAIELEENGRPDEGTVETGGLEEVRTWCDETLGKFQDVIDVYDERLS